MNTKQSFIGAYARRRPSASPAKAAASEDNPIVIANQESAQVEWTIESPAPTPVETESVPAAAKPDVQPEQEAPASEDAQAVHKPEPAVIDVANLYAGAHDDSIFVIDTMNPTEIRPHLEPVVDPSQPSPSGEVWVSETSDQVLRIDSVTMEPLDAAVEPTPSDTHEVQAAPADQQADSVDSSELPSALETTDTVADQPVTDGQLESPKLEPATQESATQASEPVLEESKWAGAGWEVDAFDIPRSAIDTFLDPTFFQSLAQKLGAAVENGLKSALITSVNRGEGRSTIAIGTVLAAAANELRIALVDADTGNPHLVDALRLDIESDWLDALRSGEPLEEVAIASIQDRFTLIPLLDEANHPQRDPVTPLEVDQLVESLRGKFDLVLFDAGPIASPVTRRLATSLDSCFMVKDQRQTQDQDVATAAQMLQQLGIKGVGLIENFCR